MAKSHFVEALERINHAVDRGDLTLRDIFILLGEKGHLILILFLSVPFLQPVPLLGLSTPLGTLIVIVGYYFLVEKPPWLPRRFENLVVSKSILHKTIELILKIWRILEKILKPRWPRLHDARFFRITNFVVVAVSAFLLALPLPIPFSNTVPTFCIVLNTIGQLEEDGFVIFASFIAFFFCSLFFAGLGAGVYFGVEYFDKLIPLLNF
ncbi:MAG: exopolysaccharide biosynthesis protein [Bdellovibrionaceae bacterium]|nr:exopolysaccharide biosynthesis protein [Pseudobdellovibrionaceae bacterium]